MAKKSSTPTFVLELPLVVAKANERIILARLEAGRRLYNATLHEALKRLSTMRSSLEWQAARNLPKGKERNEAFKAVNECFSFSEYALHDFVKPVRLKAGAPLITLILRHFSQKINFRLKNTHSFCHSVQFLPVLADFGQNNPLVTHTH